MMMMMMIMMVHMMVRISSHVHGILSVSRDHFRWCHRPIQAKFLTQPPVTNPHGSKRTHDDSQPATPSFKKKTSFCPTHEDSCFVQIFMRDLDAKLI